MPVTFFAHQAPVLPVLRRWPGRIDGLALVIGSMAPDFAYIFEGTRFRMWAHAFPALALFCVPVTLVMTWTVARLIAPVVPDHLPAAGAFRLPDYRGLATWRFRAIATPVAALLGALSHVALDHFTHDWGWFARNFAWYRSVVVEDLFGRRVTVFRVVQYAGHVGGTAWCLWLLHRYGRARWMADAASEVAPFPVTSGSRSRMVAALVAGVAIGSAWIVSSGWKSATSILRLALALFAAVALASWSLSRQFRTASSR